MCFCTVVPIWTIPLTTLFPMLVVLSVPLVSCSTVSPVSVPVDGYAFPHYVYSLTIYD